MNLYIQTEDGQCVNHPALESNLVQAFGGVPDHWKPFVRVEQPALAFNEVLESEDPVYQQVDGVWTDVWVVRTLTTEEVEAKKEAVKQSVLDAWALISNAFNFTAWVYDDETQRMVPPIPRLVEEGKIFRWSGTDNNWKEAPPYPKDGGMYKFDFAQWIWVAA